MIGAKSGDVLNPSHIGLFDLSGAIEARLGIGEGRQVHEDFTVLHDRLHSVGADVDLAKDKLDVVWETEERRVPLRGDVIHKMDGLELGYPQVPDEVRPDVAQRSRDTQVHRPEAMISLVSASPSRNLLRGSHPVSW